MKKLKLSSLPTSTKKVLSREELKKVIGGTEGSGSGSWYNCATCIGSPGTWYYTSGPVSFNTCETDIWTYCPTQSGHCYTQC